MSTAKSVNVREVIDKLAKEFSDRCGEDVIGIIILRDDGLPIYSYFLKYSGDPKDAAAMISLAMGPSRRAYRTLMNNARLDEVILSGPEGKIIVRSLPLDEYIGGRRIYIGVLTSKEPNLGLILTELDRLCRDVLNIFLR
ncbi:MAG: hypothetical protein GXO26_02160 [Crenarchaeota archaeon]|jgi:predicted regulator of Ras-like GTPase activity (Roadblock/LC7/MglB family)|nr:hypothetical protein [Thermoproteota archaeon]